MVSTETRSCLAASFSRRSLGRGEAIAEPLMIGSAKSELHKSRVGSMSRMPDWIGPRDKRVCRRLQRA